MKNADNIVICSGGFDPCHSGHIRYLQAAARFGRVVAAVNSDEWLIRKKSKFLLPQHERLVIMNNIKGVMMAIGFDDSDNSAKDAIRKVREMFPHDHIIFANGGDRTSKNIPEMDYPDDNLSFEFGVGGIDKENSSSWILERYSKGWA